MKLRARDLGVHLGRRWLFRHLDLHPGSFTAVIGPNGAGKSTLLRCLAGLQDPTEGTVVLDDRSLDAVPRRERARALAYLPQNTPLYHDLRAEEVVMLGRLPHLPRFSAPSSADRDRVIRALSDVGAVDLAPRALSTLSSGERQRVMLARMLATEAPLLVLDEPTTALDIGHALRFLDLLRGLSEGGRLVIVALHDLDLADRFATTAVCLHGDDEGTFDVGQAGEVMQPSRLGEVFAVHVERTQAGRLHVDLA
jgi:iron complex transport system ATP-binding protein